MEEIELLLDHYSKLFGVEGEDFDALVRNAYGSRQNYLFFHERLKSAEIKVSDAARKTLGSRADVNTLSRIEKATEEIRQSQIKKIFGS
jgi:hypothetical protein